MWILYIVIGVICLAVGIFATDRYYRSGLSKEQQELAVKRDQASREAEQLLEEAQKTGESKKRDLLLQAKEEIQTARLDLEREVKERRNELRSERQKLDSKDEQIERTKDEQSNRQSQLDRLRNELDAREAAVADLEEDKHRKLSEIAQLSWEEAREQVIETAEQRYRRDIGARLIKLEEEAQEQAEDYARELVVTCIQRFASDIVSEATVSVVPLANDEMKGRIIGREGRNIRSFEQLTGVDLIIDDTPEAVVLSSFDPVRREIAQVALEKLVQDGRIHPARIEQMVDRARAEVEETCKKEGERVAFETGVMGLAPEIKQLLGRLRYRTSYGQNVLQHAVEVSWLSGMMAGELGLDVEIAKRAGLLHDLGKAIDFEMEGTHVSLGAEIARKHHEPEEVINSIESHHGEVDATSAIAVLVEAADTLSAARPGARRENLESYIKRLERLEEIASSYAGVEKSYAIQAGREIRVLVSPEQVSDEETAILAHDIAREIESSLKYPGQIKVNIIRETRVSDIAQ